MKSVLFTVILFFLFISCSSVNHEIQTPHKSVEIKSQPGTLDSSLTVLMGEPVYQSVDISPEIEGGLRAFQENVFYPNEAKVSGIQGRVLIELVVTKTGEKKFIKANTNIGYGLEEASLEAVSKISIKSGILNGKPVNTKFVIPSMFKLKN